MTGENQAGNGNQFPTPKDIEGLFTLLEPEEQAEFVSDAGHAKRVKDAYEAIETIKEKMGPLLKKLVAKSPDKAALREMAGLLDKRRKEKLSAAEETRLDQIVSKLIAESDDAELQELQRNLAWIKKQLHLLKGKTKIS